jgi:hypothetical protein
LARKPGLPELERLAVEMSPFALGSPRGGVRRPARSGRNTMPPHQQKSHQKNLRQPACSGAVSSAPAAGCSGPKEAVHTRAADDNGGAHARCGTGLRAALSHSAGPCCLYWQAPALSAGWHLAFMGALALPGRFPRLPTPTAECPGCRHIALVGARKRSLQSYLSVCHAHARGAS